MKMHLLLQHDGLWLKHDTVFFYLSLIIDLIIQ